MSYVEGTDFQFSPDNTKLTLMSAPLVYEFDEDALGAIKKIDPDGKHKGIVMIFDSVTEETERPIGYVKVKSAADAAEFSSRLGNHRINVKVKPSGGRRRKTRKSKKSKKSRKTRGRRRV
jgi:hypothetical protein